MRGGSQQLEREDAAAIISKISSQAEAAGEHPLGRGRSPRPMASPLEHCPPSHPTPSVGPWSRG